RLEIWTRENFRPQPIRVTNRTSPASRLRVTAGGCLRRHTQPIVIPNESRGIPPCKLQGNASGFLNSASTAFRMTITSFPKVYFREHRLQPRPPPPACSSRSRDQGRALPSVLQRQTSWHVQARSPKELHRSARAWRCFAKFPGAGLGD